MRRRWLWIAGSIAALLAAFYAVLVVVPPPAPYEFLHGQRPIGAVETWSRFRSETWYSFEAKSRDFDARAWRELEPLGFEPRNSAEVGRTVYERFFPGMHPGNIQVSIIHDTRFTSDPTEWADSLAGRHPGWTTVVVQGPRDEGLLENMRRWLGL